MQTEATTERMKDGTFEVAAETVRGNGDIFEVVAYELEESIAEVSNRSADLKVKMTGHRRAIGDIIAEAVRARKAEVENLRLAVDFRESGDRLASALQVASQERDFALQASRINCKSLQAARNDVEIARNNAKVMRRERDDAIGKADVLEADRNAWRKEADLLKTERDIALTTVEKLRLEAVGLRNSLRNAKGDRDIWRDAAKRRAENVGSLRAQLDASERDHSRVKSQRDSAWFEIIDLKEKLARRSWKKLFGLLP